MRAGCPRTQAKPEVLQLPLLFVEGKNTLPAKNNVSAFNEEISDISYKFMDSLQLACGIWFGGHNRKVEIPKNGIRFFSYGVQIVFVSIAKLMYLADSRSADSFCSGFTPYILNFIISLKRIYILQVHG